MLTAILGPVLALHLMTSQVIHSQLNPTMQATSISRRVYVHLDWQGNEQSPVSKPVADEA